MQTKQEVAIKWLVDNPLTKEEDIIYIQSHMMKLTQLIPKAENQNKSTTSTNLEGYHTSPTPHSLSCRC